MGKKSIASKIIGKIRNIFSRKPKKPARISGAEGHRGIAAGNRAQRQEANERFLESRSHADAPFTEEEIGKWRTVGAHEVEDFLNGEAPLFVHSTNVESAQFFPEEGKMLFKFLKGGRYMVSPISPSEAMSFAQAQSKGGWYHDYVRKSKAKSVTKL